MYEPSWKWKLTVIGMAEQGLVEEDAGIELGPGPAQECSPTGADGPGGDPLAVDRGSDGEGRGRPDGEGDVGGDSRVTGSDEQGPGDRSAVVDPDGQRGLARSGRREYLQAVVGADAGRCDRQRCRRTSMDPCGEGREPGGRHQFDLPDGLQFGIAGKGMDSGRPLPELGLCGVVIAHDERRGAHRQILLVLDRLLHGEGDLGGGGHERLVRSLCIRPDDGV